MLVPASKPALSGRGTAVSAVPGRDFGVPGALWDSSVRLGRHGRVCAVWQAVPGNCLLVSIQRGRREMIPRGNTVLLPGDTLAVMTAASDEGGIYDAMRRICT